MTNETFVSDPTSTVSMGFLSASDLKLSSIHLISRIVTLLYSMPYVYNIVKHVSSLIIYRPVQPMESKRKNKTGSPEKGHIPLDVSDCRSLYDCYFVYQNILYFCFFLAPLKIDATLQRLDDGRWFFFNIEKLYVRRQCAFNCFQFGDLMTTWGKMFMIICPNVF
jgi:hypothetical protein